MWPEKNVNKWTWLCSNKTLFKKKIGPSVVIYWLLDRHLCHISNDIFRYLMLQVPWEEILLEWKIQQTLRAEDQLRTMTEQAVNWNSNASVFLNSMCLLLLHNTKFPLLFLRGESGLIPPKFYEASSAYAEFTRCWEYWKESRWHGTPRIFVVCWQRASPI